MTEPNSSILETSKVLLILGLLIQLHKLADCLVTVLQLLLLKIVVVSGSEGSIDLHNIDIVSFLKLLQSA